MTSANEIFISSFVFFSKYVRRLLSRFHRYIYILCAHRTSRASKHSRQRGRKRQRTHLDSACRRLLLLFVAIVIWITSSFNIVHSFYRLSHFLCSIPKRVSFSQFLQRGVSGHGNRFTSIFLFHFIGLGVTLFMVFKRFLLLVFVRN